MPYVNARRLARGIGLAAICYATGVWAAEWSVEPQVYTRLEVNDNVNLLPGRHDRQTSISVSPSATFSRTTERSVLDGSVRFSVDRYPGDATLNEVSDTVGLGFHDQAERLRWGATLSHVRDSTLETELAQTGIVNARKQRTSDGLSPDVTWSWSERLSTTFSFLQSTVNYTSGANLADYNFQRSTLGTKYLLSERTAATLQGFRAKTTTTDDAIETVTTGATIELAHDLTETLNLTGSIGQQRTDSRIRSLQFFCPFGPLILCEIFGVPLQFQAVQINTSDKGLLFDFALKRTADTYSWRIGAGRDTQSTATGLTVETTRYSADFNYSFDERRSAGMSATMLRSRYITGLGAATEYQRVDAFYSCRLGEYWNVGSGVALARQNTEGAPSLATARSAYVSMTYAWPKIAVAR